MLHLTIRPSPHTAVPEAMLSPVETARECVLVLFLALESGLESSQFVKVSNIANVHTNNTCVHMQNVSDICAVQKTRKAINLHIQSALYLRSYHLPWTTCSYKRTNLLCCWYVCAIRLLNCGHLLLWHWLWTEWWRLDEVLWWRWFQYNWIVEWNTTNLWRWTSK